MVTAEDIAREVERAARALGVWWDGSDHAGSLMLWTDAVGVLRLSIASEDHVVDRPTAALFLLGHARALQVQTADECSACRERGSNIGPAMWEWSRYATGHMMRMVDWLAERESGGWTTLVVRTDNAKILVATAKRACPECSIGGEPTGRYLLAWERAIIDATKPCPVRRCESGRAPHPHGFLEGSACQRCRGSGRVDGDPATRTALTVLAHRLADPEHAAVFGDWLAEQRDPAAFPAPRDGLAALLHAWLHAWLAGPCPASCRAIGGVHYSTADDRDLPFEPCPSCNGHGVAIGRYNDEIAAMLREISQAAEQGASEAAQ